MNKRRLLSIVVLFFSALLLLVGVGGVLLFMQLRSTACDPGDGSSFYGEVKVRLLPPSYICDWSAIDDEVASNNPEKFNTNTHHLLAPYLIIAGGIGLWVCVKSLRMSRQRQRS